VTEWEQFRALDLTRLKKQMVQPVIVDLRNIYRPDEMAERGFTYESVGQPADPRWRDGGPAIDEEGIKNDDLLVLIRRLRYPATNGARISS
jgi:hypothetical protein